MSPELHHVGIIKPNPTWHRTPHLHKHDEIVAVFRGRMRVEMRSGSLSVQTGDVLFYPKGVVHEEFSDRSDPVEFYFIGYTGEEGLAPFPLLLKDLNGRIRALTSWLYAEQNTRTGPGKLVQGTFLEALLSEMRRIQHGGNSNIVERIRNFMRAHIDQALTLDGLARQAGVSKFHFLRQYKKLSGRTPMEDLRQLRVDFARNLILTSDLPLKIIAPMTGLGDEYSLSRIFRKYIGMCPSRLRASHGALH